MLLCLYYIFFKKRESNSIHTSSRIFVCVCAKGDGNYKYLLRWIMNDLYYLQAKRMGMVPKTYGLGTSTKQTKNLALLASLHPSSLVSGNKAATWEFLSPLLPRVLPTPHCPAGFAVRCLRLAGCGQAMSFPPVSWVPKDPPGSGFLGDSCLERMQQQRAARNSSWHQVPGGGVHLAKYCHLLKEGVCAQEGVFNLEDH